MVSVFPSCESAAVRFPGSEAYTPFAFFKGVIMMFSCNVPFCPITVDAMTGLSKTTLITLLSTIFTEVTAADGSITSMMIASFTMLDAAASAVAVLAAVATRTTLPGLRAFTMPLELSVTCTQFLSPAPRDQ